MIIGVSASSGTPGGIGNPASIAFLALTISAVDPLATRVSQSLNRISFKSPADEKDEFLDSCMRESVLMLGESCSD